VRADAVRQMLGLPDRTRLIDLFGHLASGDIAAAFGEFRDQYDTGADPVVVLSDLAEFVNFVTRVKIVPSIADNVAYGETERLRARDYATKLSMRVLSRMWQMLLKGITEVQGATRQVAAAEMVLVRIAYAADLPTPDEAVRMLEQNGGGSPSVANAARSNGSVSSGAPQASALQSSMPRIASPRGGAEASFSGRPQMATPAPDPAPSATPVLKIATFPELVALAAEKRDLMVRAALEADVRLVRIEDGRIELALERTASRTLINDLSRKLEQWTGRRWAVIVSNAEGQPTLRSQALQQQTARERAAESDPRVQEVLARFPGAKVIEVRRLTPETPGTLENNGDFSGDPSENVDNDD
jgi:DNA polymerase-3 subunit gamma/tau